MLNSSVPGRIGQLLISLVCAASFSANAETVGGKICPAGDPTQNSDVIASGSEAKAYAYYNRIDDEIGFRFCETSMDMLIQAYLGYPDYVSARSVEIMAALSDFPDPASPPPAGMRPAGTPDLSVLTSEAGKYLLNSQSQANGVRTATFFAPKIVNYAKARPYAAGWRKMIYMPAVSESVAESNGIKGAYILFNYANAQAERDPLLGADGKPAISQNNQIILVPDFNHPRKTYVRGEVDTAYFAVYGPFSPNRSDESYQLLTFLTAGFDIPDDKDLKNYYVPDGCAHCHGHDREGGSPHNGVYSYVKPNYIDTDNLYGALDADFPEVKAGDFSEPLLVKKRTGPDGEAIDQFELDAYTRRFEVIRQLNRQMYAEGEYALRKPREELLADARANKLNDLFQVNGAAKWLDLHGWEKTEDLRPKKAVTRGYGFFTEEARSNEDFGRQATWMVDDKDHQQLADKMNQYCFRCHSTIKFSALDMGALRRDASNIIDFIEADFMPAGRSLPIEDENCIINTLRSLADTSTSYDCQPVPEATLANANPPVPPMTHIRHDMPETTPAEPPATTPALPDDEPVEAPSSVAGSIEFFNQAGYVANFVLVYLVDGVPTVQTTGNIAVGQTREFALPANAENIAIGGNMIAAGEHEIFDERIPHPRGEVCKKVWGTIFSPQHGPC